MTNKAIYTFDILDLFARKDVVITRMRAFLVTHSFVFSLGYKHILLTQAPDITSVNGCVTSTMILTKGLEKRSSIAQKLMSDGSMDGKMDHVINRKEKETL